MSVLTDIQKWMTFFGWSNGGNPGSAKRDTEGNIIARHGDATWIADVEEACASAERAAARLELERRDALRPR